MAVQREFLGWHQHFLHGVVEHLVERYTVGDAIDLRGVTLVFPGNRPARRLTELLVEAAEARDLRLSPPRTVTVGALPELLYAPSAPLASEIERVLGWYIALHRSPEAIAPIVPDRGTVPDFGAWLGLAEQLVTLSDELGAGGLSCADVAARVPTLDLFNDERWAALATIEARYLARLAERGFTDRTAERRRAVETGAVSFTGTLIMVGVADLNPIVRASLEHLARSCPTVPITALVYATPMLAERFDEFGAIAVGAWVEAPLPTDRVTLEVRNEPRDVADAVLEALAAREPKPTADQITVGVADTSLAPVIAERLARHGLKSFQAEGAAITTTAPLTFFDLLGRYLGSRSFGDLAALVRHTDIQRWLAVGASDEVAADGWLGRASIATLDRYQMKHLQARIGETPHGSSSEAEIVRQLVARLDHLCGETNSGKRPLPEWAEPLATVLVRLYDGRKLNRFSRADAIVIDGLEALQGALADILRLDPTDLPLVTASEAIRFILRRLRARTVELASTEVAIEILGWLELPYDDAAEIIVGGFNEGFVPESLNGDPFLPESLRRALGLLHNDRRYARDAFALTALAEGPAHVTLIQGRRSIAGDPLSPSRLLLTGDSAAIARVVTAFYEESEEESADTTGDRPSTFTVPPQPKPLAAPLTQLSVSGFKTYLQCPYRFYLRHVLNLQRRDDADEELSPLDFGTLAHSVLRRFASSSVATSRSADKIFAYLQSELRAIAFERFGQNVVPAVFIQTQQLTERLRRFATWQAERAAAGWIIEHTELPIAPGTAILPLPDGGSLNLIATIDRIDRHTQTGEWAIFDYKVSDGELDARTAHLHPTRGWIDLQLPLYHFCAVAAGIAPAFELGYIHLSAVGSAPSSAAGFSSDELTDALHRASEIGALVRREVFWPPTDPVLGFDDFAALCGVAQFQTSEVEGEMV
jgi:inactivated superfamily I helicase